MSEDITRTKVVDMIHDRLFDRKRGTKQVCKAVVDAFFDEISEQVMVKGNTVGITRIGVFSCKLKNSRMAQNPKTNEPAVVKPRELLAFSAARPFRYALAARVRHFDKLEAANREN
ncbi:HU family DNA-binding protein [Vibrio parahaemolyticus]|uniref:HU family DNA-binding protein n=1 Tax=Vibrio parahaemolyticus TaxID=670 RepID=UPI003D81B97C